MIAYCTYPHTDQISAQKQRTLFLHYSLHLFTIRTEDWPRGVTVAAKKKGHPLCLTFALNLPSPHWMDMQVKKKGGHTVTEQSCPSITCGQIENITTNTHTHTQEQANHT